MITHMQVLCMCFFVEATTRDKTKDSHLHTKYDNTHAGTMDALLRGGDDTWHTMCKEVMRVLKIGGTFLQARAMV